MVVGEVVLGAFLGMLFTRLTSPEFLAFVTQEGLKSKMKQWEGRLKMIEALLIDADKKQTTNRAVKIWLDDLQDLAYDIEDIVDEFTTEALRRELMADRQASTSEGCGCSPACLTWLNPCVLKFNACIWSKINKITSRLDGIYMRRKKLGLTEIEGRTSSALRERPPSTSTRIEPAVRGRDEDIANIITMVSVDEPTDDDKGQKLKMVASDEPRDDEKPRDDAKFRVLPIVGMGGIGKTTVAREVLHSVKGFKPKTWACVSNDHDVLKISREILQSITGSPCNLDSLDALQKKLQEEVAGKRFLLVLDDVREMEYGLWESLKSPFAVAKPGSLIIVTTRDEEIAKTVAGPAPIVAGPKKYYELKLLSDDHCWSIFEDHVGRDAHENLESFCQKVMERCSGLPLAARTLGGLLLRKTEDEWEDILTHKIWDLPPDDSGILPVLKLSYHYLPADLKRCFVYCAILPKNYEFEEMELVLLWMAEGIIQQPRDEQPKNNQLEDVGSKYFHNLLSRSIFQRSSTDSSKFKMHDLVNELAQWVSGKTSYRLEDELGIDIESTRFKSTRHSSYSSNSFDRKSKFEIFHKMQHLRTFLPMSGKSLYGSCYMSNAVISDLLPKLKKLRVLSLQKYYISKLPDSIGRMRHLRYFNLSNSKIISLPESTSFLLNLQILILRDCSRLLKLPSNMRNLIKLQYLDISGAILIGEMPVGMKDLKCLLRLSNFIVGKETGSSLKDLAFLKFLRGELSISRLENATDIQQQREVILSDKDDLEVLVLEWGLQFDESRNAAAEVKVVNMLQPPKNIKKLTIRGYGGTALPSWLCHQLLSRMVDLTLEGCANCTSLPPLGLLPSLRNLSITKMQKLTRIGTEIFGDGLTKPFQSLEALCFKDMEEWGYWEIPEEQEQLSIFPCLRHFSVSDCPKLSGRLPDRFPSLEKLVIHSCKELLILFSSLPMLHELDISGCKGMAWRSPIHSKSLKSMCISDVSVIGDWLRQGFHEIKSLEIENSQELVYLSENNSWIPKSPQGLPGFNSLRELSIHRWNAITSLPDEIQHKAGLESLKIEGCGSLEYIIRGHPPLSLKKLEISFCLKLQRVFDNKHVVHIDVPSSSSSSSVKHTDNVDNTGTSLLENLRVMMCPSLVCISSTSMLPATLTFLDIWRCRNLTTVVAGGPLPKALKSLHILECPRLESIADRFDNNNSLKFVLIQLCENLQSIPEGLHTLSNLHRIMIWDCPSLVYFPQEVLPDTLIEISIRNCETLKALPNRMHSLNSLRGLDIRKCPLLCFPEEGFPTNLTSLAIEDLKIYDRLVAWGLDKLTSLKRLEIVGCPGVVYFPQKRILMRLPSTLIVLTIERFPDLMYLYPEDVLDLNSLEYLRIKDCPNITFLPALPCSLLRLNIDGCPVLKKRCKRGEGPDWSKIANIPCVKIDGRFIYKREE